MENIHKIAGTITKDADKALEQVRGGAETAWETGLEKWKGLGDQSKEAMAGAQRRAEDAWEDAQEIVQKHPGKAVGIALLLGAAIGALLGFRNKK